MKIKIAALLAGSLVLAQTASAADLGPPPQSDVVDGVKIGLLTCDVGGGVGYLLGSSKSLDCTFSPASSGDSVDRYVGEIRKFGVDVGFTTRGRLIWAVFAPTSGYHRGSLAGLYQGASAEATLAAGVGTNVLFGGTAGSVHLQTISVTGQLGLNAAATGTSVTLTPSS
ncbi:DUF992 domain-containing protein [Rhizobium sp. BK251]|uniref:DUF992 domain-containing protein n=1 Tax=Rhizobium sp. BK251 TaxID=2512125 RepID=UPI00104939B2|nr:DUF992 domain-containing protein [Rhizobium sp. BK251]TCL68233.1 uncharacterized protein DUF992 [Rhizobium sp. BK251]